MSIFDSKGKKKSDDTVLEDAAAAREKERTGKVSNADQLEHTLLENEDAAVKAKMAGASEDRVQALEKELAELRKIVSNTQNVTLTMSQAREVRQRELKRSEIPQCQHCGQYTTVCSTPDKQGNNHVTLRVLPDRPEHLQDFPGVIWNNVVYCGIVVVPAICASDILAAVRNWSEYKFSLHLNRGRTIGKKHAVTENIPRGGFPLFGATNG